VRDEIGYFNDAQNQKALLESLQEKVGMWQVIGPPYKVISTDTEYEALFTDEQRKRLTEWRQQDE